ncbi:hypothetical protein VTN96DRAFT_9297 [Rasamsonia emersonii]
MNLAVKLFFSGSAIGAEAKPNIPNSKSSTVQATTPSGVSVSTTPWKATTSACHVDGAGYGVQIVANSLACK